MHTLWLHLVWCTHYVLRAPLALFLLYHELFFDCELHEKHTLALPPVMHALGVASFACSFCIVPWTLFWPWTFFRPWTLWRMHFGSTPCDACTTCGELCCLFFFISLNSFPTGNSYLMVNSLRQALWLCPVWRTHYVWWALLALFLLYHELFSVCELFTNHELCDARTLLALFLL